MGVFVTLLLVVPGAWLAGAPTPTNLFTHASLARTAVTGYGNVTCNPVNPNPLNSSPSALNIQSPTPNVTLTNGMILGSVYQFEVVNFTPADLGITIEMPALVNDFPTNRGIFHLNRPQDFNVTITGKGWTTPAHGVVKKTLHNPLTITPGTNATLSSAKIAVMANASYGSLSLAFRWHWLYGPTNGPFTNGPWTVPNASFLKKSQFLPSEFMPAQFAGYAAKPAGTALIGSTYVLGLKGYIANVQFRMVLEYPNGTEIQTILETVPNGTGAVFNATVPIIGTNGFLVPGKYLIHVHDVCDAIIHSFTVVAAYPAHATVTFVVSGPASCGPISFNNVTYASNSTLNVTPSSSPIPLSIAKCRNHQFVKWNASGGVEIYPVRGLATNATVSASGTITARFL